MSKETIFISYSRDNTDFVMNLAKTLRNAGADIWLDQLDIKVGENWDIAVQNAMQESENFMIILSKSSVNSNNVMDEVGYALSANKKVVPVLMEECEIPFRLQRRQFADFTGDKEKGMKGLVTALGLEYKVAKNLVADTPENKGADPKRETPKPDEKPNEKPKDTKPSPAPQPQPSKPKNKSPYIIIGIIAVLAIVAFLMKDTLFIDKDLQAWEAAQAKDTEEEYNFYLRTNESGKYILAAKDSILSKQKQREILADNTEWNAAIEKDTEDAYNAYIKHYPRGIHVVEANNKIQALKNRQALIDEDDNAWNAAKDDGSVHVLASYLTNAGLKVHAHKTDAINAIKNTSNEGWLYYGRKNGDKANNDVFDLVWRDNETVEKDMMPVAGDVLIVNKPYMTYRSVGSTEAQGRTGKPVKTGKKVLLTEVTERGSAIFVKVIHD
ncbi:toll/interleukin-1 receptor domain-containing protein [Winogradskyella alexanderae]|uniref:Toll/interleukin-1 receptor domain-containing protein n=1 Tax=Winogradskyella alexanderae TaxID=2877123 RepID=A0ABS7XQU3_9FLAO|nr:toll/interleukin-1 receptor domain-containing protein [Winogradskyella alexanderae]MCA0132377.1 toll/interleukin-1 receptor domain-containing protein [Winogradskyella alexanderae]